MRSSVFAVLLCGTLWLTVAVSTARRFAVNSIAVRWEEGLRTTADVDGDGLLDVVPYHGEKWYRNADTIFVAEDLEDVTVKVPADIDGDGRTDFVAARVTLVNEYESEWTLTWFRNDRKLKFVEEGVLDVVHMWTHDATIDTGDMDQDGAIDVVLCGSTDNNKATWYRNKLSSSSGSSNFTKYVPNNTFASFEDHMVVADMTGDGAPDILGIYSSDVYLLENINSASEFSETALGGITPYIQQSLQVVDFDGDGDNDFITSVVSSGTITRWMNDGAGQFTRVSLISGSDGVPSTVAGDLNNDGQMDLVTFELGGKRSFSDFYNATVVWYDGLDAFRRHPVRTLVRRELSVPLSDYFNPIFEVATVDYNNDGDLDILAVWPDANKEWSDDEESPVVALFDNAMYCDNYGANFTTLSSADDSSTNCTIGARYQLQTSDLDGTVAFYIAVIVLPIVGFALIVIGFVVRDEPTKAAKIVNAVVLVEAVCAFAFLGYLSDHHKYIRGEDSGCNVLFATTVSGNPSGWIVDIDGGTLTADVWSADSSPVLVACEQSTKSCALGNGIKYDDEGRLVLAQADWIRRAVCDDLSSYTMDEPDGKHTSKRDVFHYRAVRLFLCALWTQAVSYYPLTMILEWLFAHFRKKALELSSDDRMELLAIKGMKFVLDRILAMWIAPLAVLAPVHHPNFGTDALFTGAQLAGSSSNIYVTAAAVFIMGLSLAALFAAGVIGCTAQEEEIAQSNGWGPIEFCAAAVVLMIPGIVWQSAKVFDVSLHVPDISMIYVLGFSWDVVTLSRLALGNVASDLCFTFHVARAARFTIQFVNVCLQGVHDAASAREGKADVEMSRV